MSRSEPPVVAHLPTSGVDAPTVSIIIIAHNARRELGRCIASIDAHAGVPTETILVDNGSSDGTAEWLLTEHPSVHVVRLSQNVGEAARKDGLPRAQGGLIMFLDSDAALTEGALPRMVDAMSANPSWGLIGPRLAYDDGSLQLSSRRFPPPYLPLLRRLPLSWLVGDSRPVRRHLMTDEDHGQVRPVIYVLGACQLFRASMARAAGTFADEFFGPGDLDWCIRIRDAGGEIVYFPKATVVHSYRRSSSARPLSRMAVEHLKGFYLFQWRYRHRRRELIQLGVELDRSAAAGRGVADIDPTPPARP